MKNFYLLLPVFAGVAAFSLASCTESESYEGADTPSDNAIRFAANTEFSRSKDYTTNNLTAFNVYAYTGTSASPTLFMDNVEVTKTGTNTWTYSPVKYWPSDESVDFYAFAPSTWVGEGGPLKPVAYDSYPGTEDIIYAVAPDLMGHAGMANAQVLFNFRHALSKVTVKMRSSDADLVVKVSNVAMANVMTKGNFNFPLESTSGAATSSTTGKWTDQNTPLTYLFHMSQDAGDVITLTTTATDMSDTGMGMGGGKFMMPQELVWNSNGSGNDTYLTVMCCVYDAKSGAKLWPNANTPSENIVEGSTFGDGLLKFQLSTSAFGSWQPGYHYVYNIVINANEDMGAIEFGNPTVDTYVDVESTYE